jgi:uncharacterized protein (DUF2141 family)
VIGVQEARCHLTPPEMAIWHLPARQARRHAGAMQNIQLSQVFRKACGVSAALFLSLMAVGPAIAGDLTIEITGIAPGKGQIYIALYDRPETFPTAGQQRTGRILDASEQRMVAHFEDLPPGEYAAVAFQDTNGNGKLDKNFLGIPKEPYGFSNGAKASPGAPKFSTAAVTLSPDAATSIVLK